MPPIDFAKIISALIGAIATGLPLWLFVSLRRSARNAGRTELEIALDELRDAVEAEHEAKATADPSDDAQAARCLMLARKRVATAKRLKGFLEALAGDVE